MSQNKLHDILYNVFGFNSFKPGQVEIIEALLAKKNALAMLPTGGGKSLIYQMVGQLVPGLTIIVTPLLSLMQDQVSRLQYMGEKRVVALNSLLNTTERTRILKHLTNYQFLFVSPEMLGQDNVVRALQKIKIALLVIDEAHTIISWGPDFRPDYLRLPFIHHVLGNPRLLLLTATATQPMLDKLYQQFHINKTDWLIYRQSVDRPNIHLHTEILPHEGAKRERLSELVRSIKGPGILYFTSRKLATHMAEWLSANTGKQVATYHAGMSSLERYQIQQQFMLGQIDVISATSAFGMGIDKDDIRYVVHYHLSSDLANYLQEIGRAGRDGKQALAISLYVPHDEQLQLTMIDNSIPSPSNIKGYYMHDLGIKELGEQQANLLAFYEQQRIKLDEAIQIFEQRRYERIRALLALVDYATSTQQLRHQLLSYFSDDTQVNTTTESSGADNLDLATLKLLAPKKKLIPAVDVTEWRMQIGKLFNLG